MVVLEDLRTIGRSAMHFHTCNGPLYELAKIHTINLDRRNELKSIYDSHVASLTWVLSDSFYNLIMNVSK